MEHVNNSSANETNDQSKNIGQGDVTLTRVGLEPNVTRVPNPSPTCYYAWTFEKSQLLCHKLDNCGHKQ